MLIHIFGMLNLSYNIAHAPVAQLDRVPGYEPGGRRFESFHTRHIEKPTFLGGFFHFYSFYFCSLHFRLSALFKIQAKLNVSNSSKARGTLWHIHLLLFDF